MSTRFSGDPPRSQPPLPLVFQRMPGFALKYLGREQLASRIGLGHSGSGIDSAVDDAVSSRKRTHGKHGKGSAWMRRLAGGFGVRRMLRRCFRGAF